VSDSNQFYRSSPLVWLRHYQEFQQYQQLANMRRDIQQRTLLYGENSLRSGMPFASEGVRSFISA